MLPDTPRHRRLALVARVAYAIVICIATLSDLSLDLDAGHALARAERAVGMGWGVRLIIVDGLRNVVLFAGFGAVWAVTSRSLRARSAVLSATLVGAALSAFVESVQLYSPRRYTSWLDFVTNAGGAALGALVIEVLVKLAAWARGRRSYVGVPAFGFAGAYLAALFGEGVAPTFPRIPQPSGVPRLRERFGFMLRHWAQDPWGYPVPWTDAALAFPAGVLVTAAAAELGLGYAAAAAAAAALCTLLPMLAQLVRAAGGLPIDTAAFAAQAVGGLLGAAVAWRGLPAFTRRVRGAARAGAVLAAYVLVLALWSVRPFALRTDLGQIAEQFGLRHWMPLAMLGVRSDVFSVADVTGQFFLLLPVGALLAVWPLRARGWLRGVLPAAWIAAAMEVAQALVAERYFDATDLLIRVAGAMVGWVIVRQAGYQPYGEVLGRPGPPPPPPEAPRRPPPAPPPPRAKARIIVR